MPRNPWRIALAVLAATLAARADGPSAPSDRFSDDQKRHWAFQPVRRPDLPDVVQKTWVRNPIDRFIRAANEGLGFPQAPEADRRTLIRRVFADLIGLPPSPEEVRAFVEDPDPLAYEALVDRLLASPAFGERWAQHWLDLAHYADSNGFELDADRPDMWRYRDWLIQALNDDMPYDRFVTLQVAGEEAEPGSVEASIASGFCRAGPREVVSGNIDPDVKRQSELTEITGTVGSTFLGLTVGCARCHDHKFDPLPSADYYGLQAFFAGSRMVEKDIATDAEKTAFARAEAVANERLAPLKAQIGELEAPYRAALRRHKEAMLTPLERAVVAIPEKKRTPEQKKRAQGVQKALNVTWEEVAAAVAEDPEDHAAREWLKREISQIQESMPPPPPKAEALIDEGDHIPETFILKRGDPRAKGPKVDPHPLRIALASQPDDAFPPVVERSERTSGRRLALARWLTRPDNPLTPRVIVNRLWQGHFGRGIVASSSDFGLRGELPSHPELLDYLASELVAGGWRLKPIHRLMVTSATYRQATRLPDGAARKPSEDDPEDAYLWTMPRRRMDAEAIRDAFLVASGELNPKRGGPGVRPPIEPEVEDLIFTEAEVVDLWPEAADRSEHLRRSIYLFRKRNVRDPMFDAFDAPDRQTACPSRNRSVHALQPLILLNGRFALDRARGLAGRVFREASGSDDSRLDRLSRIVVARSPSPSERSRSLEFLDSQAKFLRDERARTGRPLARPSFAPATIDEARLAAWVDLALAMLNRDEFLTVP